MRRRIGAVVVGGKKNAAVVVVVHWGEGGAHAAVAAGAR